MHIRDADIPPSKTRQDRDQRYNNSAKGKTRKNRYRHIHGRPEFFAREFIAYDGEGITLPDGIHLYTLFASSAGIYLQNDNGLSTITLFEALLQAKRDNPTAIHVIYGGSYDFNMILADMPLESVNELYERGTCVWRQYRIQWRRGKSLRITDRDSGTTVLLYDVVSFFQRPFVQACDEYLGDNFLERDMIVANKAARGKFSVEDNETVRRYNEAELKNLVNLMSELRSRLAKVQLRPARWDGPGAIATALLQRERIKDSMTVCPPRVAEAGRFAYFGGRFEMLKCGDVDEPAYEYDINSAYPSALRHVPNLTRGSWHRAKVAKGDNDFAIFRITWEGRDDCLDYPHPFPCRLPDGRVWYPPNVTGWYWAPEVAVAEFSGMGKLTIHEGWRFVEEDPSDKPFGFIEPMYQKRQALKKAGDGAHVGLKLALNSLYGKTCQRIGWRIDAKGNIRTPPFHQLEWAGFVTSHCRANIYRAAMQQRDAVIAFETDALFMREPIILDIGSGLGQWEQTTFERLAYCQSGFYFGVENGKPFNKTRGCDRGSVTYDDVRGKFWTDDAYIDARLTRFNGVGIARQLNNWDKWRRWEVTPKRISLTPTGKRIHLPEFCDVCASGTSAGWHSLYVPWIHPLESCEFPIPWINPNPDMIDAATELTEDHADEMSFWYE